MNGDDAMTLVREAADTLPELPPPPAERLIEGGRRIRRRRSVAFAALGSAAVVMVAAFAAIGLRPSGDDASLPATQHTATSASPLPGRVPSEADIMGSWRAVTLLGQQVSIGADAPAWADDDLTLQFSRMEGQLWDGISPNCNTGAARVRLGPSGQFSTFRGAVTARLCTAPGYVAPTVTVDEALAKAALVRLDGDKLLLFDRSGSPVAVFQRQGNDPGADDVTTDSTGASTAVVPDVLGLPTAQASHVLEAAGLRVVVVQGGASCPDGVDCDFVSRMDPAPGVTVDSGSAVDIIIGPHPSGTIAVRLCSAALHRDIGSASSTSVGAIRQAHGAGPMGYQPALGAFSGSPPGAPGAWCWVGDGQRWTIYGVGPSGESVAFGTIIARHAPVGPPAFF
jgi:hypothetical protein